MKLVLIQAYDDKIEVQKRYPPLGLAYIAAYLEKYGGYKDVFIETDLNAVLEKIPDVVGISSVTPNFNKAVEVAKEVKIAFDIPIIIGGAHITALPHTLPECFDFGIVGEGEQTMLELLNALEKNGRSNSFEHIDGLVFRKDNKLIRTTKREMIKPLDRIPFPKRDILKNHWGFLFKDNVSMITSRGCPYNCRFCSSSANWRPFRFHSAEYVVDEIRYLIEKYDPKIINFYDDLFIANTERLVKIVDLIKVEKINEKVQFNCSVRADLLDEKTCKLFKEMNMTAIGFGGESGSDKILGYLKKNTVTVAQNQEAIDLANKYGISIVSSFIIGSPSETKIDILKTYDFINKNKTKLSSVDVYPMTPYPGTEIWDFAKKRELVTETMDWSVLNQNFEQFNIDTYVFLNQDNMTKLEFYEYFLRFQNVHQDFNERNNFASQLNATINQLNATIKDKDTQIAQLNTVIENKDTQIAQLNTVIKNRDIQIAQLNVKLHDIFRSTTWQVLTKYQRLVDIILPPATKRRHVYDLVIIGTRIILNDGFVAFLFKFEKRMRGSILDTSKIPLVETNIVPPYVPLSLGKSLCGRFTFPSENLNEIRIFTTTHQSRNSYLNLKITDSKEKMLRKATAKYYNIQDNNYTSFIFKPIKDSKGKTFFFKLISNKEPSAMVWYNDSITSSELTLYYDENPIKGSISFQAFGDIEIKSMYDLWILKNEPSASKLEQYKKDVKCFEYQPKISIVTPVYNPDVAWIKAAVESVVNQVYENWELCLADASTTENVKKCLEAYAKKDSRIKVKFLPENKGIVGNSNVALSLATGEYIGLLDHDDELSPDALYEVIKYLQNNRDTDMIYSDEDKIDLEGNRKIPFFKPDWSLDMFLSCMYTCHFGIYKKKIIDEIGGFREGYDGSQDYDLVLRFIEKTNRIHHIPKILYHWRTVPGSTAGSLDTKKYAYTAAKKAIADFLRRNNIMGEVLDGLWTGSYYVKRKLLKTLRVSIIIPTKDNVDVLKRCIESIFQKTIYLNYEIIIVNNNSTIKNTYDYFEELKSKNNIKILEFKKDFNFSAINNFAVQKAEGEVILFLNNDTEIINGEWLNAMLEHVQRKEVGAVGARLFYPNNTIQHSGIIIGIIGDPPVGGHAHRHLPKENSGYFGKVHIIHNLSAVTAACIMMRKEVFEEIGGFDEKLAIAFNDVDLCLKIREKGYLIVYTPYAELYHYESLSRGHEDSPEKKERFSNEVMYLREKWGQVINKGDPYYNPNLSLNYEDFRIKI